MKNKNSSSPRRRLLALSALTLLMSGCAIQPNVSDRVNIIEQGTVEQAPLVTPSKSGSVLREGLACMDRMLAAENTPTTLIAVKNIPDPSGLFSTGTKEMLITALSRMSRTSQAFRVVDYEVDALRQDTVQTLTSLLLNNNQMELRKPQIYISGAISFGDKTVVSKRQSLGISTAATDTGYSWDVLGSAVGLDLHLGDMNTRTLYSGIESANELIVATGGKAVEIGAKATGLPKHIYRVGVQYEVAADNNQGAGAAVRLLVDLAAIELVGKWAKVPYWDCIDYEQNHPEFMRQMRAWFDEASVTERWSLAQRVLQTHGMWSGTTDGSDSPAFRKAVTQYQASQDLTPVGVVNFETYTRLMRSFVGMSAEGKLRKPEYADDKLVARPSGLPANEPDPRTIALSMVGRKDRDLKVGEAIVVRVVPPRTGYLYCYYQDAGGSISQVYPNPMQPSATVQGRTSVLIPDISKPNSFLIETARGGTENMFCAMTAQPLKGQIPATLTNANLEPIKSVTSLAQVQSAFEQAGVGVMSTSLDWNVQAPEPAPAAGRARNANPNRPAK
ncbi:MAG: DUF4384 domain-containing protein [Acidovorax sp.]|jgi:hypothetical protein